MFSFSKKISLLPVRNALLRQSALVIFNEVYVLYAFNMQVYKKHVSEVVEVEGVIIPYGWGF